MQKPQPLFRSRPEIPHFQPLQTRWGNERRRFLRLRPLTWSVTHPPEPVPPPQVRCLHPEEHPRPLQPYLRCCLRDPHLNLPHLPLPVPLPDTSPVLQVDLFHRLDRHEPQHLLPETVPEAEAREVAPWRQELCEAPKVEGDRGQGEDNGVLV